MTDQRLTDAQIRAAFEVRAAGSPSPELAERIAVETRRLRQQPRLTLLPGGLGSTTQRLLWAAVISATSLALVGGLLLAGSQNDDQTSVLPTGSPTATPSEVPEPTAAASEAPSPSPEATPSIEPTAPPPIVDPMLDIDRAAVTLVSELRVRSEPTVGESSARLEPLLPAGLQLLVIEESVAADGYAWYHVIPFDPSYPTGWVAAGSREGESWIAPDQTACPALPLDAASLASLKPSGGLACYGDMDIEVTGPVTCSEADIDYTIGGPSWMGSNSYCAFVLGDSQMQIHLDGVAAELSTSPVPQVVTGHFADPEANTCEWVVDPPVPPRTEITAACRTMFVVTAMESPG
jgi:hypothetical protein